MESSQNAMKESKLDKGHRVGNFHNYYEFNPPDNRLSVLEQSCILDYLREVVFIGNTFKKRKHSKKNFSGNVASNNWAYCDLGCNEGDLSLAIAKACIPKEVALGGNGDDCYKRNSFHVLGLDIDSKLIERANYKKQLFDSENIKSKFRTCNLNDEREHLDQSETFLKSIGKPRFDLTSIFSTTMWIHIHGGDDGLTDFLQRTCSLTNFLLIEPQPSKCYRSVNVRLRKMNRPEIDTSSERLKMRIDIESEIDRVLNGCKFERVNVNAIRCRKRGSKDKITEQDAESTRTKWNRNLQLYKRVEI